MKFESSKFMHFKGLESVDFFFKYIPSYGENKTPIDDKYSRTDFFTSDFLKTEIFFCLLCFRKA